jgi:hypothetical protein
VICGGGKGPVTSGSSKGRNITEHAECIKLTDDHTGTLNKMVLLIILLTEARDLLLLPLHPDHLWGPLASY